MDQNHIQFRVRSYVSARIYKVPPFICCCFLQDILKNDDITLDNMFISSLVSDLIKVSITFLRSYQSKYHFSLMITSDIMFTEVKLGH